MARSLKEIFRDNSSSRHTPEGILREENLNTGMSVSTVNNGIVVMPHRGRGIEPLTVISANFHGFHTNLGDLTHNFILRKDPDIGCMRQTSAPEQISSKNKVPALNVNLSNILGTDSVFTFFMR